MPAFICTYDLPYLQACFVSHQQPNTCNNEPVKIAMLPPCNTQKQNNFEQMNQPARRCLFPSYAKRRAPACANFALPTPTKILYCLVTAGKRALYTTGVRKHCSMKMFGSSFQVHPCSCLGLGGTGRLSRWSTP